MANAYATLNAVEACKNEVLKASLPVMYSELEKCQKSLEGYLEQKRNKFPRFFFVSNPGLLIILSQGSDPLSMNAHYEKVFDAIENVDHNKKDKTISTSQQLEAPNQNSKQQEKTTSSKKKQILQVFLLSIQLFVMFEIKHNIIVNSRLGTLIQYHIFPFMT